MGDLVQKAIIRWERHRYGTLSSLSSPRPASTARRTPMRSSGVRFGYPYAIPTPGGLNKIGELSANPNSLFM